MEMVRVRRLARRSSIALALSLVFLVALLASIATANHPGPQYGAAVAPQFVAGNPTCGSFISGEDVEEFKIQPVTGGTFSFNGFSVTITPVTLAPSGGTLGGPGFDWEATGGLVLGVVAKGGPNANLYDYEGLGGLTSDDDLHSPVNHSNLRFYGLSHISFCVVPAPAIGAVSIVKTAKHATSTGSADLVATFTIVDSAGASHQVTTNAAGTGCVDGVALGLTQSITETTVPSGYDAPSIPNVNVTEGDCASSTGPPTVVNVENIPLTDISYTVTSQQPGATSTVVECWEGDISGDPDHTQTISSGSNSFTDLQPTAPNTTLTCQFTVDP